MIDDEGRRFRAVTTTPASAPSYERLGAGGHAGRSLIEELA